MAIVVFQHDPHETAGILGNVLLDLGHQLRVIELYRGPGVPPDLDDVDGVVSMGGPMNVDEADKHPWMNAELAFLKMAHERNKPVVGICLGAQLIGAALGGKVAAMATPEVGFSNVRLAFPGTTDPIYQGIPWDSPQCHFHGQEVSQLPPDATPLAGSKACKNQAFKVGLTTYAFQYHFEWTRESLSGATEDGLARKAGLTADALAKQLDEHYDTYRRLGDRLCENLGLLLFPTARR